VRYGGNTSCVTVEAAGEPPIVFDLGTGLRPMGEELEARYGTGVPLELTAFLTHLHWDHIIGLPFCRPLLRLGGSMDVYGPPQDDDELGRIVDRVVVPPFFPVKVEDLHGDFRFHESLDDVVAVGSAKVTVRQVPHVGTTLGFRVDAEGCSFAFVSDHQMPENRSFVADAVLELCDGADLVVHDAQYTEEEFLPKATWGHSTIPYAVHVAAEAGARRLVLFHHDPLHTDDVLDALVESARAGTEAGRLDAVDAAAEGWSVEITAR